MYKQLQCKCKSRNGVAMNFGKSRAVRPISRLARRTRRPVYSEKGSGWGPTRPSGAVATGGSGAPHTPVYSEKGLGWGPTPPSGAESIHDIVAFSKSCMAALQTSGCLFIKKLHGGVANVRVFVNEW